MFSARFRKQLIFCFAVPVKITLKLRRDMSIQMPLAQSLTDGVRQRTCPRPTQGCELCKCVLEKSELLSESQVSKNTLHTSTKHVSPGSRHL